MPTFPCCEHCPSPCQMRDEHCMPCWDCLLTEASMADPYIEAADANPERVGNGCMIYAQVRD